MASVKSSADATLPRTGPVDRNLNRVEPQPRIRSIGPSDLRIALSNGIADFAVMPTYAIFVVLIYPIVGLVLLRLTFGYELLPLVFPLAAGFPLIGPLAAVGLYELSRRREQGLEISWSAMRDLRSEAIRDILAVGVLLLAIFVAWIGAAMTIYRMTFGDWVPPSLAEFANAVLTTSAGWTLIVVGCCVGLLFAIAAFSVSVVSIPLLLDRNVGFGAAVATSVRAVLANPVTMALWGFIVASALLLGSIPFFIGLAVVLPVLGHATWHLYRRVAGY